MNVLDDFDVVLTFGRRSFSCGMIVAFKSHVFITGREFIEQLLRILGLSVRQATHFVGERLCGQPRPLLVDLLCAFVEHEF